MTSPSFNLPPNDSRMGRSGSWVFVIFFTVLVLLISIGAYLFAGDLIRERQEQEYHHWGERNQSIAAAKVELLDVLLGTEQEALATFASFELVRVYAQESQALPLEEGNGVSLQKPYLEVLVQDFKKQHRLESLTVVGKNGRLLLGSALTAAFPIQQFSERLRVEGMFANENVKLTLFQSVAASQDNVSSANAYAVANITFTEQLKKALAPLPLSSPDETTEVLMRTPSGLKLMTLFGDVLVVSEVEGLEGLNRGSIEWVTESVTRLGYLEPVPGSPFIVRQSVSAQTVLASVRQFRHALIIGFILVSIALLLFALLVWRQGAAMRLRALATQYREHAVVLEDQKSLLRSVIDSIPDWIGVKDQQGRYFLFNRAMQNSFDLDNPEKQVVGEADLFSLADLVKLDRADIDVLQHGQTCKVDIDVFEDAGERDQKVNYLSSIRAPFRDGKGDIQGVVALTRDVTSSVRAQKRIKSSVESTMKALCLGIEANDPFFANHSRRVADLVDQFHQISPLSEEDHMTCRQCASLLAVERAGLPSSLLHKADELSDDEKRALQSQDKQLFELLSDLAFDLPVMEVLGRLGELLRQEPGTDANSAIEHMAQILMITNAWCAMTAPRSWRAALDPGSALNELRSDPDRYVESYVDSLSVALELPAKT